VKRRALVAAAVLALLTGCGSAPAHTTTLHGGIRTPDGAVTELAPIVAAIDAHQGGGLRAHTFENRERLLPHERSGWYTSYDVLRPGSRSRGPQRLVVGRDGKVWFTADHYDHFVRLR
jgi:guanyl-specific ribonuclease Sa